MIPFAGAMVNLWLMRLDMVVGFETVWGLLLGLRGVRPGGRVGGG